ncbi:ABC transporter ATP-binding protein [Roseomonas nepalensis]|uniref:ABC transporter ATP-binding protein n=1 Tax=Muricoccus nepalensis TaxID=1854500 RepID=A0A502GD08_9PROT|nr:ABC transporter ATP-binding protein [Roseomonas nepalensis]TPG59744.1 ABC transporter ATP-binding protein [Roseomonas nepalensis]
MEDCLVLDDVGVRFGGLKAVDGVSLRVPAGQRRAIIGPNGAGKTTLFNAVTGVVRATSGRVLLEGRDVTRLPVHARAHRGMGRTFQITNLFPRLTVIENMHLALRGLSPRRFALLGEDRLDAAERARVEAALGLSRLAGRLDREVRELSYGEQRQLEMAMALATEPRLLLLDEPAAGLSPVERAIVSDIIRALPRAMTVVLIEHDMDLVLSLVDWVTCLDNGRLLVEAAPDAIRGDARVQEVYLGKARHDA